MIFSTKNHLLNIISCHNKKYNKTTTIIKYILSKNFQKRITCTFFHSSFTRIIKYAVTFYYKYT